MGIGYGPVARLKALKKQYVVNMHYRLGVARVRGKVRPLFRRCKTVTLMLISDLGPQKGLNTKND